MPLSILCLAPGSSLPVQACISLISSAWRCQTTLKLPCPKPSSLPHPFSLPHPHLRIPLQLGSLRGGTPTPVGVLRAISTPPCLSLPPSSSSPSPDNSSSSLWRPSTSLHSGCRGPGPHCHRPLPALFKSLTCPPQPPVAFPVCDG